MYMCGGPIENENICTCMIRSFIKAHSFRSMQKDKKCEYNHTLIDDSGACDGDKEHCSVREDNSNKCKDSIHFYFF